MHLQQVVYGEVKSGADEIAAKVRPIICGAAFLIYSYEIRIPVF